MTDSHITDVDSQPRANIVGTGLIGGSIGLALRELGWFVTGGDADEARTAEALASGAIDAIGLDPAAAITFIATPVAQVVEQVERALVRTSGVVTDVASVKGSIAAKIRDSRFVPGHPMAGSEQEGLKGARAEIFSGAVWVLTPGETTAEHAYTQVRTIVRSLGADVVSLGPDEHDKVVATVSHVPHLAATSLMVLADDAAAEHQVLLRLAAGGFRDMTRIASGHPGIWPDICVENKTAIAASLDGLIARLTTIRDHIVDSDHGAIHAQLVRARTARTNLPTGMPEGLALAEFRVPIPDRAGEIARLTTLAPEVNIYDFEIAHSTEGSEGVAVMVVGLADADAFFAQLTDAGYHPAFRPLAT